MRRLTISVIKSTSLGYRVFRGSVKAKELYPALWIDRYDEDVNPLGYQRPFNTERSKDAARYANDEPNGFWPENILNIRARDDGHRTPIVPYSFSSISVDYPDFGTLTVDFDGNKTKAFGDDPVPWERAFSEVDCQHRLGMMADSEREVTVVFLKNSLV